SQWLWVQNGQHRAPLPRLVFLLILKLTHGDFRACMYASTILVGTVTSLMILGIRHVRGGKTRWVDALFPLALLHLGHWENFAWSNQLMHVMPLAAALLLILVMVVQPAL